MERLANRYVLDEVLGSIGLLIAMTLTLRVLLTVLKSGGRTHFPGLGLSARPLGFD